MSHGRHPLPQVAARPHRRLFPDEVDETYVGGKTRGEGKGEPGIKDGRALSNCSRRDQRLAFFAQRSSYAPHARIFAPQTGSSPSRPHKRPSRGVSTEGKGDG